MDGIESWEDLFQWTQAQITLAALQATAKEIDQYPNGREVSNTSGLKMKATASRATVAV
jgi:hypothetical protein